jgi:hypothetical protein
VNFTLSLATDPISGPFTSKINATAGTALNFRLNQVTAGPKSIVAVSFGDGMPPLNITLNSTDPCNFTYTYTLGGTFTISALPLLVGAPNATTTVNTITSYVNGPPFYTGICNIFKGLSEIKQKITDLG